jgi:hypothetical protein
MTSVFEIRDSGLSVHYSSLPIDYHWCLLALNVHSNLLRKSLNFNSKSLGIGKEGAPRTYGRLAAIMERRHRRACSFRGRCTWNVLYR